MRELQQHAGAIAGGGVGAGGAAVLEPAQNLGGVDDYVVAGVVADVADEAHAAGVMLEFRAVQAHPTLSIFHSHIA